MSSLQPETRKRNKKSKKRVPFCQFAEKKMLRFVSFLSRINFTDVVSPTKVLIQLSDFINSDPDF